MKREYICDEAQALQDVWKATLSIPVPGGAWTDEQREILMRDRTKPEYKAAIEALVDHLSLCPICAHLRQPPEPVAMEAPWMKWIQTAPVEADYSEDYTDV